MYDKTEPCPTSGMALGREVEPTGNTWWTLLQPLTLAAPPVTPELFSYDVVASVTDLSQTSLTARKKERRLTPSTDSVPAQPCPLNRFR